MDFLFNKESWNIIDFLFFTVSTKQHNSFINNWALKITDNNWAANQHIRMISEGSCDTENWSNDAENSALITEINYIILNIFKLEISQYSCCTVFVMI